MKNPTLLDFVCVFVKPTKVQSSREMKLEKYKINFLHYLASSAKKTHKSC